MKKYLEEDNMKKQYKHKQTKFQTDLIEDGKTILKIVELLYPDFDVDWDKERGNLKISAHPCYTWVLIQYKDGSAINFAIDNHEADVFGKITAAIYAKLNFTFKVIPFGYGSLSKDVTDVRKKRVDKLLRESGYQKPSFEEFWNEYHTD